MKFRLLLLLCALPLALTSCASLIRALGESKGLAVPRDPEDQTPPTVALRYRINQGDWIDVAPGGEEARVVVSAKSRISVRLRASDRQGITEVNLRKAEVRNEAGLVVTAEGVVTERYPDPGTNGDRVPTRPYVEESFDIGGDSPAVSHRYSGNAINGSGRTAEAPTLSVTRS